MGVCTGLVACLVHAGPVGIAALGILLAFTLMAAGAWYLMEARHSLAWLGYVLGSSALIVAVFYLHPTNDILVAAEGWPTSVWIVVGPLGGILGGCLPRVLDRVKIRRRGGVDLQGDSPSSSVGFAR